MDSITETVIRNITEIRSHQESALVPVTGQSRLADIPLDKAQEAELRLRLEKEYGIRLSQPLPCTVGEIAEAVRSCCEEKKRKARRIITIPNLLSLFRLLLIPVYAMLYVHAETAKDYLLSGAILALSCITDLFDGLIARRFDQISNLGKALDPIADKATQGVMLLCVAGRHPILWWLFGFFALKEGFQLVMGCWYLRKGQMLPGALMSGKVSTVVLFLCMILLVIFPGMHAWSVTLLLILCAFFMAVSFVSYIKAYFGRNKKVEKL